MNGFADHGLDENAFGEKKGFSEGIRSFDAFRKTLCKSECLETLQYYFSGADYILFSSMFNAPLANIPDTQPRRNPPTPGAPPQAATLPCSSL